MFVIAACVSVAASAQSLGLVGGVTGTDMKIQSADIQSLNQYHIGIAYNIPLALGIALQPELLYNVKGVSVSEMKEIAGIADISNKIDARCGYAELGVQLQAGINAGVARVYAFGEPFVGYAITSDITSTLTGGLSDNLAGGLGALAGGLTGGLTGGFDSNLTTTLTDSLEGFDYVNKLEYGLAIGAGVQVLKHIQVSGKYFWNFGSLYNGQALDIKDVANQAASTFVNAFKNQEAFAGFSLSLALLF